MAPTSAFIPQRKVLVGSSLSGSCFKFSKWVSLSYDPGVGSLGQASLCVSHLRMDSPFPTVLWFSWT